MHPKKELFETTMLVQGNDHGISYDYFRYHILPLAKRYAAIISEVNWNDRLQVRNESCV